MEQELLGQEQQCQADTDSPKTNVLPLSKRQHRNYEKESEENQTEAAIRRGFGLFTVMLGITVHG
jgi:hypothetical protein